MSDQNARVTCDGSPLPSNDPVVGPLLGWYGTTTPMAAAAAGTSTSTTGWLRITDANDIPINCSDTAATQVSLHQAVFPQQKVVGWYRVATSTITMDSSELAAAVSNDEPLFLHRYKYPRTNLLRVRMENQKQQQPPRTTTTKKTNCHLHCTKLLGMAKYSLRWKTGSWIRQPLNGLRSNESWRESWRNHRPKHPSSNNHQQ